MGFVTFRWGNYHYENPKFLSIFEYGHSQVQYSSLSEVRAHWVYVWRKWNPPWRWDYENYGPENKDMFGRWYPMDIANIRALEGMESARMIREQKEAKRGKK